MAQQTVACEQVLAIDIGGTAAKFAFVSQDGRIVARGRFGTTLLKDFEAFLEELYIVIASAKEYNITKVAISSPGVYDTEGNCTGNVENLPFLGGTNIPAQVRAHFPGMDCAIRNDGVCAAMGEYHFGAAKGCQSFVCLTLGTGIGGAYILNGQPHLGHHGQSCEIGYFNYKSQAEYYEKRYSTKGILRALAALLHLPTVSGRVFTRKVEENSDARYTAIYDEWVDAIGQLIANMVLVLDPAMVVIGGGISRERALLQPAFEVAVASHLPPSFRGRQDIQMATCGNDAGLLGAASMFLAAE